MPGHAQHSLWAAGTTVATRNAHRSDAAGTTGSAGAAEQASGTTIAAVTARDDGSTTVAAVAEPARRTAVTSGVSATSVADHAAVAAVARTAEAGTFVGGVGVAVAEQDACVGIVGGARPDENADEVGDRVGCGCRAR